MRHGYPKKTEFKPHNNVKEIQRKKVNRKQQELKKPKHHKVAKS